MAVSFVTSAILRHSRPARGPPRRRSRRSHDALPRSSRRNPACAGLRRQHRAERARPNSQRWSTTLPLARRPWPRSRRRSGAMVASSASRLASPGVFRGTCSRARWSTVVWVLFSLQPATEVTKARLCQFQSMITSSALADYSMAMAMVSLAQRWCGTSTPVIMLSTDELHLLEPLDATQRSTTTTTQRTCNGNGQWF